MEDTITLYLKDIAPFISPNIKEVQRVVLRYLHDRGVEGESNCDEEGNFIRYIKPSPEVFERFSIQFYSFITTYQKTR